ncbi:MAG: DUF1499 domain-containing protein [Parvibaculum sp.]|uniref:DUF1499 domain-containing protein n=1 Tax=Parvibaculum sp. TaxID=2024848 RepID=UPI003C785DC2
MAERSRLAAWGLRLAVLALVVLVLAAIANRFGFIGYTLPIRGLALAALIGAVAVLVSLAGLVVTLGGSRAGAGAALLGILIGAVAALPVAMAASQGRSVPRIHDITTDLANPPQFDAVVILREDAPNSLDRSSPPDLAELQRKAYPDLETFIVREQPGKVYEAALETAKEMGWRIDAASPEKGLIEATATTRLMGFRDDVAIRVSERDGAAAVDLRSVSRVGISDLGANAARIRAYLAALKTKLATPAP